MTWELMRNMLQLMDPEEDYLTIVAAEEHISASEAKRKKDLEEAHANLKGRDLIRHFFGGVRLLNPAVALTRFLEVAKVSSTRPGSVPSEQAHEANLNELDSSKMSLAKAISDAEAMLASKEAELSALKDEARRLEVYDPALEHEKELDGSTLRLAIYKGIGFEPIIGKDGKANKMLIRAQSGDVHTVDFTSGKSDHEYTQLLWKIASS
ncbi:hypothetical protein CPB84DRAFT_1743251 [Gymnopilus junonius]|uniref:Kinetochore protein Spc24 n=1 Tax=Gymnopilus junonius TaxID=109634 RepID=A0A9P5TSH0_GYMJU|nr:hypothetical protein CPB84DRAFT_1743251 [Gymnopilus junonius]